MSQARFRTLQRLSEAPLRSTGNIKIEINTALAARLTGYPFEYPSEMIRNHGASLIDEEIATPSMLRKVVSNQVQESIFIGPKIPPEAIIAIFDNDKCIWRRPTEVVETAAHPDIPDSGTRFDRILNVAIGTDDDVLLAQRYLHRKHPSNR